MKSIFEVLTAVEPTCQGWKDAEPQYAEPPKADALLKERGSRYGFFGHNAAISQELKRVFRSCKSWDDLTEIQQEGLDQIACKLARFLSESADRTYTDNMRDVIGYATLILREQEEMSARSGT